MTLHSMTGFGRAAGENGRYRVAVTAWSVNHRHLDLALRLPDLLRPEEQRLRRLLARRLQRGRVEMRFAVEPLSGSPVTVEIREEVVRALQAAARGLAADGLLSAELRLGDLVRLPDTVRVAAGEEAWDEQDGRLLAEVCGAALDQLEGARRAEGTRLAGALSDLAGELERLVGELEARREEARQALAERTAARIAELLAGAALPAERLAQEVAVLAERSDVQEELDRLAAHLAQLRQLLGRDGALGRRLDFLAQEIGRELNTLGAKCRDTEMVQTVLDAKVVTEQIREQARNVE